MTLSKESNTARQDPNTNPRLETEIHRERDTGRERGRDDMNGSIYRSARRLTDL